MKITKSLFLFLGYLIMPVIIHASEATEEFAARRGAAIALNADRRAQINSLIDRFFDVRHQAIRKKLDAFHVDSLEMIQKMKREGLDEVIAHACEIETNNSHEIPGDLLDPIKNVLRTEGFEIVDGDKPRKLRYDRCVSSTRPLDKRLVGVGSISLKLIS